MSNKIFKCDHCDYTTNRKYNLEKVHMKKHTETTTEHKYECAPCGLTFRCKSNLKVHLASGRHKKRIIDACPDAVITTETKHNDIVIKTKKRIDPTKSHIYLKKVNVTKPKKPTEDTDGEPKQKKQPRAQPINKAMFKDPSDLDDDQINNLVDVFIKYCKGKIDLNDFYDFDYYRDEPEPEAEYADIIDTINDNDFTLF